MFIYWFMFDLFWGGKMVILVDQYNLPDDIYEIIFATSQQKIVAKVLVRCLCLLQSFMKVNL